jgi:WD40 repeat protein
MVRADYGSRVQKYAKHWLSYCVLNPTPRSTLRSCLLNRRELNILSGKVPKKILNLVSHLRCRLFPSCKLSLVLEKSIIQIYFVCMTHIRSRSFLYPCMPRPSFGPTSKEHAKKVFQVLLDLANGAMEEHLPKIQINCQTSRRLVIRTTIRTLEQHSEITFGAKALNKSQIRETLKRLKNFLEILEDNRTNTQGAKNLHFTLKLWYPCHAIQKNLQQLDLEWDKRRNAKYNQQATVPMLQDWGESIDVNTFHGRINELETLKQWLLSDRCNLIVIFGMGGIGKTAIATKLSQQVQPEFNFVFWRSLRNAPPFNVILSELIQFLSQQQETQLPESTEKIVSLLLVHLKQHRCLIVLDNVESIFQSGTPAGSYRPGYEGYGTLFQGIGEAEHQSCLLLTSREKPREVALLDGALRPVRSLSLKGLTATEGQQIFIERNCSGLNTQEWRQIFKHYAGNPLALQIVAAKIQEVFDGDMAEAFSNIQQGRLGFRDITDLLDRQFNGLSPTEQQVMYWIAINRGPVLLSELEEDLISTVHIPGLFDARESLGHRNLIERCEQRISLQPVILEYVTDRFVADIYQEVLSQHSDLLREYALIKAQSKDYLRQAQIRFILQPVLEHLLVELGGKVKVEHHLRTMLAKQREEAPLQPGYTGGNLLNLLIELNSDLRNVDCSHLVIWQAYLVGKTLHNVNFAHADLSKSVFADTQNASLSVVFSPDGQWFATGNADNKIRVWRVEDYTEVLTCEGHMGWVWSIAFSSDSQTLVSGSLDQTLKLWDLATGQCIKTCQGHTGWIWTVAISPDGLTLASGSNDHTVKIWDLKTGSCSKTLEGHTAAVWSVAFSKNGKTIASGGDDCTIMLWDVQSGELLRTLEGHTDWIRSILFLPDKKTIVSSSSDRTIKFWDVSTGSCLRTLTGHEHSVNSITYYSRIGKGEPQAILASGSQDQSIKLWDIQTGRCLKTLKGHTRGVLSVALHPSGQLLASGGHDSTVKFWNPQTGYSLRTLQGYSAGIKALRCSLVQHDSSAETETILASGGDDGILKLWNLQTGECIKSLLDHSGWIWSLTFSPHRYLLASAGNDAIIRFWDWQTGTLLRTLRGHTNIVFSIAFSADGQYLVSGSSDQTIKIWDVSTGNCLKTLPHRNRIFPIALSPSDVHRPIPQQFASASENSRVQLFTLPAGEYQQEFNCGTNIIYALAFNPNGKQLACGGSDRTIMLWNLQSGQCSQTLQGHQGTVWALTYCLQGKVLASAGFDQTIKLWDVHTGECPKTLVGHVGEVWTVTENPHDATLISGGQDGTIRIWDLKTGEFLKTVTSNRCYEGMNISRATGLNEAQKKTLKFLGAIEI